MDEQKTNGTAEDSRPVDALVRPDLAKNFYLQGLAMSWMSTALFKMGDSFLSEDENEALCLRREAKAFEVCSDNLTQNLK